MNLKKSVWLVAGLLALVLMVPLSAGAATRPGWNYFYTCTITIRGNWQYCRSRQCRYGYYSCWNLSRYP